MTEFFEVVDIKALITKLISDGLSKQFPGVIIDVMDFSGIVVELSDFQYGAYTLNDAKPNVLNEWVFLNDSTTQITQQFTQAATKSLQESWSVTQGMTIGTNIGLPVNPVISGGCSINLSFSDTKAQVATKSVTDTNSTTIYIAPKTKTKISVILFDYEISVPWTAKIKLRGNWNFHGFRDIPGEHDNFQGQPTPIGYTFGYIKHPLISVIDNNTILFSAQGLYSGVQFQSWKWDIKTSPINQSFSEHSSLNAPIKNPGFTYRVVTNMQETCYNCKGSGKCPTCNGVGKFTCVTCLGTGQLSRQCNLCAGTGVYNGGTCPDCNGSGEIKNTCNACNGTGSFKCSDCNGAGTCSVCGGSGTIGPKPSGDLV